MCPAESGPARGKKNLSVVWARSDRPTRLPVSAVGAACAIRACRAVAVGFRAIPLRTARRQRGVVGEGERRQAARAPIRPPKPEARTPPNATHSLQLSRSSRLVCCNFSDGRRKPLFSAIEHARLPDSKFCSLVLACGSTHWPPCSLK
jgi:hypothetical protein